MDREQLDEERERIEDKASSRDGSLPNSSAKEVHKKPTRYIPIPSGTDNYSSSNYDTSKGF